MSDCASWPYILTEDLYGIASQLGCMTGSRSAAIAGDKMFCPLNGEFATRREFTALNRFLDQQPARPSECSVSTSSTHHGYSQDPPHYVTRLTRSEHDDGSHPLLGAIAARSGAETRRAHRTTLRQFASGLRARGTGPRAYGSCCYTGSRTDDSGRGGRSEDESPCRRDGEWWCAVWKSRPRHCCASVRRTLQKRIPLIPGCGCGGALRVVLRVRNHFNPVYIASRQFFFMPMDSWICFHFPLDISNPAPYLVHAHYAMELWYSFAQHSRFTR
ncbi:hypothetical protein B0H14DRAFT_2571493 [Mycena olivaceomarginata]|nr:hypothetical protein B0H14DRAFT_2571493 [Mycena olivaceomarginata]